MGSMMYLLDGFSIVLFMILIYLLSKIIIEKNAQSISMTKILGYSDREISSLYLQVHRAGFPLPYIPYLLFSVNKH